MKKMMMALAAVALASAGMATAAENPFGKAKVGDWARYTMNTSLFGMPIKAKLVTKVTAKTDKAMGI